MRPDPGLSASTQGNQLELQISEQRSEYKLNDFPAQTSSTISPEAGQLPRIKLWAAPAALLAGILATLMLTSNMAMDTPSEGAKRPEQFLINDGNESVPERRSLPPIDLPIKGQVIQVGIFTKLSGAERNQIALTNLGLVPYVQKRVTKHGLQYAVLLGPLSASTHDEALATLTKYNYPFFHRPGRGS